MLAIIPWAEAMLGAEGYLGSERTFVAKHINGCNADKAAISYLNHYKDLS